VNSHGGPGCKIYVMDDNDGISSIDIKELL
jgi:hypothetical protein